LNALCDLFQAELVVACAQGIAGLAGVDCVGAKVKGGAHALQRTGGEQELWDFGVHGGIVGQMAPVPPPEAPC
jgi:hypothetical protein